MAKFSTSKKIAKTLMYLGLSAVLCSGIIFGYFSVKTSADENVDPPADEDDPFLGPDYYINGNGASTTIIAGNISSGTVIDSAATDLVKVTGVDCPPSTNNLCWKLTSGGSFDRPAITGEERPAWAFLNEVKGKAASQGGASATEDIEAINNVISDYITASYSAWDVVRWTSSNVTIKSPELVSALKDSGIVLTGLPQSEITVNESASQVVIQYKETYPDAKEDSAWLKTTDFLRDSAISQWKQAFDEYNVLHTSIIQNETNLNDHIVSYRTSILLNRTANQNGQILSLEYPSSINLEDAASAKDFKIKLDPTKFAIPTGQSYKLKFFVKPVAKADANFFIEGNVTLTADANEFPLTWWNFTDYTPTLPPELINSPFYDKSFPQQYLFKLVLYGTDGTSTKEELTINFDTVNPSWSGLPSASNNSDSLGLLVEPSATGAEGHFDITVTAKPTTPSSVAIVLYACNEDASGVMASDSASCANRAGQAFIKKKWTTFSYSSGEVKLQYTWNTTGTSVGPHAIMAKAFAADGSINQPPEGNEDYIDPSKVAVTVNVTNSTIIEAGEIGNTDPRFGNLLSGLFTEKASDKARGSSIVSFGQLVDKILLYSAGLIGIIAFFVIVIAGFLYMTAGGNEAQTTKAKNAILYALLGIAIYVLSYGIMFNVMQIIKDITGASSGSSGAINLSTLLQGDPTGFDLDTAFQAAERLIGIAVSFAAIVGFVMIIWASILYVTSVGDENKAETAKKTLIWSIAGTFIVSLAGFIVDLVDRFFA